MLTGADPYPMESVPGPTSPSLPWEPRWAAGDRPVEDLWTFDLRSSRLALWPFLADSSDLNVRLRLPEMTFQEREGQLMGSSGRGLLRQEWTEVPWEWEFGRWLLAERRYSAGFARAVQVSYRLVDHEGGTRLTVYFGWLPRSGWSRPLLPYLNRWLRLRYERVVRDLDELAAYHPSESVSSPTSVLGRVDEKRLHRGVQELSKAGFSEQEALRLADHLRSAPDVSLFRLRPKRLAQEWGVSLESLLALLLQATRTGWLSLSWDLMCPHCQGVRKELRSLGELRELGHCEICAIDFKTTALTSIEVTFRVLPEIRVVKEVFYCSAEPAKKPHILLQQRLNPGVTVEVGLSLSPGRYRLRRAVGDPVGERLECIGSGGVDRLTWSKSKQVPDSPVQVSSELCLELSNPSKERLSVVLEKLAEDPMALRPAELFNFQRFRDLFSEESIASGLGLEVGHQTILFTDIVGSTRLYTELGDTGAFNAVRDHFVALQKVVGARHGAVVKTIGDGMMAAFLHPEDALQAACEIQRQFHPEQAKPIALRISVHRGICLAVRLDSNIDYFGTAVNYTAKMQSVVGAGEIALSAPFSELPDIPELLRGSGMRLEKRPFSFHSQEGVATHSVIVVSVSPDR